MHQKNQKPEIENSASLSFQFRRLWKFIGLRLLLGLLGAVVGLFFFGWLTEEVLEGETIKFDDSVRLFVHSLASPAATELMRFATFLGSTIFLSALGLCIAVILYFGGWRRAAILFMTTMAGAIALNFALKAAVHRIRPAPYFDTPLPSSFSFPSGHALFSVCFYGVLAWLITARIKNRAAQTGIWALAILLIFFIGLSRVYLGVHYPSDVIAGYTAAAIWVFAVAFSDSMLRKQFPKPKSESVK